MDRYMEVPLPGAAYLVVKQYTGFNLARLPGVLMVALSGFISVALFHDWLSWNSARWELGRRAGATGVIQPDEIEGGFEWNGWYASANPNHSQVSFDLTNDRPGLMLPFSRRFFPQVKGRFALAFTPLNRSRLISTIPYTLWLPPGKHYFLFVAYTGQ